MVGNVSSTRVFIGAASIDEGAAVRYFMTLWLDPSRILHIGCDYCDIPQTNLICWCSGAVVCVSLGGRWIRHRGLPL